VNDRPDPISVNDRPDPISGAMAYRQYGYRLREIAAHLGVHEVTVSRRLKRAEQTPV
jgi:DNA-binding transcriptional regulator LsrR (DeoR family)